MNDASIDIRLRNDRVGKYFRKYLDDLVFIDLAPEYIQKAGVSDVMTGVPVPFRKEDLSSFSDGSGMTTPRLAENMGWVIGCDPRFRYADSYIEFLERVFEGKIQDGFQRRAISLREAGDKDGACVYIRAALCMRPREADLMYGYARLCRDLYLENAETEDAEYVGLFKAEAMDYFELLTELYPDIAQPYYYLGYAYLNMGLYAKADAAWKKFLEAAGENDDRAEITERLEQLKDPVEIEKGTNAVASGRYYEGIEILSQYIDTKMMDWWPLPYHLGVAFLETGGAESARDMFKKVLSLDAQNTDTMLKLAEACRVLGDDAGAEKYEKKAALLMKTDPEKLN